MDSWMEDQIIDSMIDCGLGNCADDGSGGGYRKSYSKDPLFYHVLVEYNHLIHTTDKAYLFKLKNGREQWIPKALCKNVTDNTFHVHEDFWFDNYKLLASGD